MRKDWALIAIFSAILVVGFGLAGYLKIAKKKIVANPLPSIQNNQEVAGAATNTSYFKEDAKVMYFYSDYCHWCQKEKEVLENLAKDGLAVKPMNVGEKPELAKQYNVSGTPTFIASSGERLVGYQSLEALKPWLEKNR